MSTLANVFRATPVTNQWPMINYDTSGQFQNVKKQWINRRVRVATLTAGYMLANYNLLRVTRVVN
jgi:hypothetical protein